MYNIKTSGTALVPSNIGMSVDRMFDAMFNEFPTKQTRGLSYEIKSDDDNVYAEVEVPGVDPKEVAVRVEGRAIHVETPRGNTYFTVGARVDGDNVKASVKHGLLTLTIPKRQAKTVAVVVEDNN
jgi:HSP20 family molecular chaperone IbpA